MCGTCTSATEVIRPLGIEDRIRHVEQTCSGLRAQIDGFDDAGMQQAGHGLLSAVMSFGECELVLQRAEKQSRLDRRAEPDPLRAEEAMRANEAGMVMLRRARESLKSVDADFEVDDDVKRLIDTFGDALRRQLAEAPLTPDQTLETYELWEERRGIGNGRELIERLDGDLAELERLRSQEDRGTRESNPLPVWKILAAAAILGIAVWGIICCALRRCGCPAWAMAAANVILAVAVGVFKFFC